MFLRNEAMLKVFEKAKVPITRSFDSDAILVRLNLAAPKAEKYHLTDRA